MSGANYYLAQAFSPMLKFQASAEIKSKNHLYFYIFFRTKTLANGKKETTANALWFINLKSFFLPAFCTPRHSLNLAHEEEFTQGTVLLISIRNQGKQFSREDASKTHTFFYQYFAEDRVMEREIKGSIPLYWTASQESGSQSLSIIRSSHCSAVWPAFVSFICLFITYLCWKIKA